MEITALVGERLEERDLPGREGTHLGSTDVDVAKPRAFAQQRCRQHGPGERAASLHVGHGSWELPLSRHYILDMDRPPVAHHSSADGVATDWGCVSDRPRAA